MTTEEIDEIRKLVKDKPNREIDFLSNNFMKFATLALGVVISWMFNTLNKVEEDVKEQSIRLEYQKEGFDKFNNFMENEFFSSKDFEMQIEPLKNAVNANTMTLNKRSEFIEETSEKLDRVNNEINLIKYDIIQLKKDN